jgi:hypothetical protein
MPAPVSTSLSLRVSIPLVHAFRSRMPRLEEQEATHGKYMLLKHVHECTDVTVSSSYGYGIQQVAEIVVSRHLVDVTAVEVYLHK